MAIQASGDNDSVPVTEKLKDRRPHIRIAVAQFSYAIGPKMRERADRVYELDGHADKIGRLSQKVLQLTGSRLAPHGANIAHYLSVYSAYSYPVLILKVLQV
jgi:hypothetical protein